MSDEFVTKDYSQEDVDALKARFEEKEEVSYEKEHYFMDGGFGGSYAGVSVACGYFRKRRCRNGGMSSSVFCSQSNIFSGNRSICWKKYQAFMEPSGNFGCAVPHRYMDIF